MLIGAIVNAVVDSRAAEFGCIDVLDLNYSSASGADGAGSSDLPYSGGAHGPSPFATLFAMSSYHCSLVRPWSRPMMVMVMLSHPTPPVSLLDARQLSIMFSQMDARSCFATIPRLTNSITAWEDWTSQIPVGISKTSKRVWVAHTVACYNEELVVGVDLVYLDVGERGDDLLLRGEIGALLELEVTYRAGEGEVAVDAAKVDEASSGLDACFLGCGLLARFIVGRYEMLTLVLGLVVE